MGKTQKRMLIRWMEIDREKDMVKRIYGDELLFNIIRIKKYILCLRLETKVACNVYYERTKIV